MAKQYKQANATLLTGGDVTGAYTPLSVAEGSSLVTDAAGGVSVVALVAGVPTNIPLLTSAAALLAFGPLTIAGTLTPAGVNPSATPTATLNITATTRGGAVTQALLDILFAFAATENPTVTPSVGTLIGGNANGTSPSGIFRVLTTGGGLFTATVVLPAGAGRLVTPSRFQVMGQFNPGTILNFSATVFGGP